MSYSQLSKQLERPISLEQYDIVERYIDSLSYNTKITISKASQQLRLDNTLTGNLLTALVSIGILRYSFVVRCPECSLLLETVDDIANIEQETHCYSCDDIVEIVPNDVEVIYTCKRPFHQGQQNDKNPVSVTSAVHQIDSLAHLIESGNVNINSQYFDPSDSQWEELKKGLDDSFLPIGTTTEVGSTLENLTIDLFNVCKIFKATGSLCIASESGSYSHQIDCYVRNTICNPFVPSVGAIDSFVIECKNEKRTPSGDYMKKLHSTMLSINKRFGVIVSRCKAPKTFVSLSNKIFLSSKVTIIWMDSEDLKEIIIHKKNLLEMLARKIDEVKLLATKDLRELGLYDN